MIASFLIFILANEKLDHNLRDQVFQTLANWIPNDNHAHGLVLQFTTPFKKNPQLNCCYSL